MFAASLGALRIDAAMLPASPLGIKRFVKRLLIGTGLVAGDFFGHRSVADHLFSLVNE